MKRPSILLVDKEPKNLSILENNFIEANFLVDKVTSDYEAIKILNSKSYDIILSEVSGPSIDGFHILEQLQRDSTKANIPVVFLTQKSDNWNKVKSFKLGAKDYIVKPVHVKEIVARVNMVVRRLEKLSSEETLAKKKFAGRIEDFTLSDLIETFGLERKTGILSLVNSNGTSGKVYFNNGSVINAEQAGIKGEDAIFKMMAWNKGRFSMLFTKADKDDAIMISNMGLLLEGARRMEQRDELLKHIPSLDAIVVTTSNFKKILDQKSLSHDLDEFLKLFDGERTIARIIDESDEDEVTILSRIAKLSNLGFLHVLRDFGTSGTGGEEDEIEPVSSSELEEETSPLLDEQSEDVWDEPAPITDEEIIGADDSDENLTSFELEEEINVEKTTSQEKTETEPLETIVPENEDELLVNEEGGNKLYDVDDPFADFTEDEEIELAEEPIKDPLFQNENDDTIDELFETSEDIEIDVEEKTESFEEQVERQPTEEQDTGIFDITEIENETNDSNIGSDLFNDDDTNGQNNLEEIESIVEVDLDDVEFNSVLPEEQTSTSEPDNEMDGTTIEQKGKIIQESIPVEHPEDQPEVFETDFVPEEATANLEPEEPESIVEEFTEKSEAAEQEIAPEAMSEEPASIEPDFVVHEDQPSPEQDRVSESSVIEEPVNESDSAGDEDLAEPIDETLKLEIKERFDKAKGHILVLGTGEEHRIHFIKELVGKYHSTTKVGSSEISDIFHGTAEFKGNHYLNLISFSIKSEFTPLVEYFGNKAMAYLLIIEEETPDWPYLTYLLNVMRNTLKRPCNIVFTNTKLQESQIRSKIRLNANERISFCNNFDEKESKKIVFSLFVK